MYSVYSEQMTDYGRWAGPEEGGEERGRRGGGGGGEEGGEGGGEEGGALRRYPLPNYHPCFLALSAPQFSLTTRHF